MTVQPRRQFTDEFKAQVVELANHGRPVSELAKEFDLNASLIHTWRRKALGQSQLGSEGAGVPRTRDDQAVEDELRLLRRQVAELQLDNDILKKAAVILGTKPQPKSGK